MTLRKKIFTCLISLFCLGFPIGLSAQEAKFELTPSYGIKEVLTGYVGKRVALRVEGGEEIEGIVTKVGDHLVHVSQLTKRDFYDAVIRLDRVSAVIFRVRNK
jgi:small nuclear ribonucleoprotein (snRNP)-like protein